jgi:hypothetical protein
VWVVLAVLVIVGRSGQIVAVIVFVVVVTAVFVVTVDKVIKGSTAFRNIKENNLLRVFDIADHRFKQFPILCNNNRLHKVVENAGNFNFICNFRPTVIVYTSTD